MAVMDVRSHEGQIYASVGLELMCILENVDGIGSIAVDWVTSNMYYTAECALFNVNYAVDAYLILSDGKLGIFIAKRQGFMIV